MTESNMGNPGKGGSKHKRSEMPGGRMEDPGAGETMMSGVGTPAPGMGDAGGGPDEPPPADAGPPVRRTCGTMNVHRRLLQESREYAMARARIEGHALEFASRAFDLEQARTGVTHIPVVVHVVWNTAAQNVSDAQIQSQIDVLNRDYRKLNPDAASVPAVWQPLVADMQIEFALANVDPGGNPTNGITRTNTATASFTDDDKVKSAATGGANAWPADRYLNMWVCLLGGGLLGYAQFPGGAAATDGVVITHTGFGTTGTAAAPFNLGRTATHEIGHWLNLNHIWGDDGTACTGTDFIDDTPNQAGPNFGAPTFPHATCGNGPNGDMFMNYMDYVDDRAMFMFTAGQLVRVSACLDGPRASFIPITPPMVRPLPSGPVVSWAANRLDAFVVGTDSGLYHKAWNGSAWLPSPTGYDALSGICEGPPEAVSWGPNRLDIFVRGSDQGVYHKSWNGSAWGPSVTGFENLGGKIVGKPKAVAWGPNRLDLFVVGTDHQLYHKAWSGSAWAPSLTGYEPLGGICIGDLDAAAWGANRIDIFVVGTNHAVYHKWWGGSAWGPSVTGFENLGGVVQFSPKVAAWGPNRLDLFAIGTDSALYHKWWDGSAWHPSLTAWENLGGVCCSPPEVVSWSPNRLDVFVLGTDSALYHKWFDGGAWHPSFTSYEALGGVITKPPKVVVWGPNRLDVFVTGANSALYHKAWNGSAWIPSLAGYENLGGVVTEISRAAAATAARTTP